MTTAQKRLTLAKAGFELARNAKRLYWLLKTHTFYRLGFGDIQWRSIIIRPLKIQNPENIYIGRNVVIEEQAWLLTLQLPGRVERPRMTFGDGTVIGHFCHITCVDNVSIGARVLMADRVHVSDNGHGFQDPDKAVLDQPITSKGPVSIGCGTWVGEGVSILSCQIGRNCVIGANAVVTRDVPDHCIAVGSPARIIKRFDPRTQAWVQV